MFPTTDDLASACYTLYETPDGEWLALGALEPKFWRGFCERIGRPDLAAAQHAEGEVGERVLRDVRAIMRSRTRDEWLAIFTGADVCLTAVRTPDEVAADPKAGSRGSGAAAPEPVSCSATAPVLGADTDAILADAGVTADARARLRASGII